MSPPSERTAEDWGRLAVSLPGWRWMPGMSFGFGADRKGVRISDMHGSHFRVRCDGGVMQGTTRSDGTTVLVTHSGKVTAGATPWPHPDDPATAGCLLALLGPYACSLHDAEGWMAGVGSPAGAKFRVTHSGSSLGRACIAAAEAIGRWPGGAP